MKNFNSADMRTIDRVFAMEGGYVLDFSNPSISAFFLDDLNIDFDDPRYAVNGGSKGKRLRTFLQDVDRATAARTLRAPLEYRKALYSKSRGWGSVEDPLSNAEGMLLEVIYRAESIASDHSTIQNTPFPAANAVPIEDLKSQLLTLNNLAPQPRGYAFEQFLVRLFKAYGLEPHNPFRLMGEQIDGSFKLEGEIYLVEAKWHEARTPAADLHIFQAKIQQKASWTRGLFISNSGFTEEGLFAFGRTKSIICMDGIDVWDMLDQKIPLPAVLERKVRRAAEYGDVYCSVRQLF